MGTMQWPVVCILHGESVASFVLCSDNLGMVFRKEELLFLATQLSF